MEDDQQSYKVSLPKSFLPYLEKLEAGHGIEDQVAMAVVIGLFAGNVITLAQAAELTNRSVADFIDVLNSHSIAWMEYGEELKRHDDRALQKLAYIEPEMDREDYAIADILESAGSLSPERAKELQKEIKQMREEWDT